MGTQQTNRINILSGQDMVPDGKTNNQIETAANAKNKKNQAKKRKPA